jgi:hypothetical protein
MDSSSASPGFPTRHICTTAQVVVAAYRTGDAQALVALLAGLLLTRKSRSGVVAERGGLERSPDPVLLFEATALMILCIAPAATRSRFTVDGAGPPANTVGWQVRAHVESRDAVALDGGLPDLPIFRDRTNDPLPAGADRRGPIARPE